MSQSDIVPKILPAKPPVKQFGGSGRVGGDPPKTSFLAFGAKIGSSVGVKTHHFRVKIQKIARKGEDLDFYSEMVRRAGLEPAQAICPRDFKSLVSTIPPSAHILTNWRHLPELNWRKRFCRPLRNHSAKAPHLLNNIPYLPSKF